MGSSTLTSVALGQAESELTRGRTDANSVVIVITDGWPMSPTGTKQAAKKLMGTAKVLWVPVGKNAPINLIKEMASLPQKDHVIPIKNFAQLRRSRTINKIVS